MASKQSKAGHAAKVDPLHAARTQGAAAESAKSLTHSLPFTAKKTNVDDDDTMLDDVDVNGSSKVPHKKTIQPAEGVQQNGVPDGTPMMESDSNYHADEEDGDELDDDVYVMHVSTNWDGTLAGSWWSDFGVRLYDLERGLTTAGTQVMLGHEDRVTGLSFGDSHNEPHAVFTCAEDGVAAMWDRRTGRMEQKFRAPLAGAEPVPFLSIDVGAENSLLAAGTDEDEESRLLFWDRRAARPLGSYEDSHYEGITQIRFNPMRKTELATAGLDGLVCYFDIRQRTEEDALVSVLNAESPVSKIGFFGPSQECLYCLTHSETLHLFHAQKAVAMAEFPMIRERLAAQGMPSDFLIDCAYVEGPPGSRSQSLLLVSGDHTGTICLGDVTLAGVQKLCTVQSNLGHKKDVRSVAFLRPDPTSGVPAMILSGGEDGLVCEWTHAKTKRGPVRRGGARRKSRR
ncbi:WD repeat-containing protein 89 [Hondaea fermentalgiana]|uniref:WD repeat-containing protein 89 n=1 Tax=Hondaea fermentalgiana TaxID=2315210 RepID=A0A2R5G7B6_9STRA|nr:WD repeat-containing protein 89 [Hondaea fermentalgiana]|eukprot:GBG26890.1 WD repeat-containing protein 89 [Hondaea fermentalgiana]